MALKIKSNTRINVNREEALKEIHAEEIVPITFKVPRSLRQTAKIRAAQNNTTVTDILTDYLKKYVEK